MPKKVPRPNFLEPTNNETGHRSDATNLTEQCNVVHDVYLVTRDEAKTIYYDRKGSTVVNDERCSHFLPVRAVMKLRPMVPNRS